LLGYLPWKVLTGADLPDRWAAVLFLVGGILFLSLVVGRAFQRSSNGPPPGFLAVAVLLLGGTSGVFYVVARSVVYEVALSSAFFWMAAAVYLATRAFRFRGVVSRGSLALSGVALGFAMASRHSYVLPALVLALLTLWWLAACREGAGAFLKRSLLFGLPPAAIGLCLLVYNQTRFDDPLEFGLGYQIGIVDPAESDFMDPGNIFYNWWNYLLQPPLWEGDYPFVSVGGESTFPGGQPESLIPGEGTVGLLVSNPYLLLLPFLAWGRKESVPAFRRAFVPPLLIGLSNFVILGFFSYTSYRYQLDFLPWVVLVFCLFWVRRRVSRLPGRWNEAMARLLMDALFGWSLAVHFLLAVDRLAV